MPKYKLNLVKGDYSKFIYSIDVNKSVEYFCESASNVSDRLFCALVTTAPPQPTITPWGNGAFMFDQILITIGLHALNQGCCIELG
ncbi:hypothetical protein H6G97_46305 [Nostoc flagelliforme FACHB-838]|uniref:Uncharacterized protein n=1 Tax=Nostoc flagelliforme FACHB-838 TaxID=2692904 RepID=A0ABR8E717_9NOSO|nr:hypothetical protein [Nostoc flagelliforme]MBD2536310.1 hypothetical protein [Nostoc flagelliforme FACHB-838]